MIRLNVEEYCHQCLDFTPDVIPPARLLGDDDEHARSDTIVQCVYRKRCAGIKRYLEQQTKEEISG